MPGNRTARHPQIESLREWVRTLRFRFLKRIHRRGQRDLWAFDRTGVARGVAIGLFFGVSIPVAQIVVAVFVAVAARANVLVTAASTFITNPVTLPFLYYYAYLIGTLLTQRDTELVDDLVASEEAAEQALEVADWFSVLLDWASSIALPFLTGLVFLALTAALLGYLLVHAAWVVCGGLRKWRKSRA